MTASVHSRGRQVVRIVPVALLFAVIASGCDRAHDDQTPDGLLGELAREMDGMLAITPRLSVSGAGPLCIPAESPVRRDRTPCVEGSRTRPSSRVVAIAARARRAVGDGDDPQAMHAAALIDLLYGSDGDRSFQRAISSLQTAARLAHRPAPILADMAAAYLIRGERARAPRDLAAALEAAEQALALEPGSRVALFNRALALQRFELLGEAARGWREFLSVDSTSAWATEAQRKLREVLANPLEPPPPAADAPLSVYTAYAVAEPQRGRELGLCQVLGAWANAVLREDVANAEEWLRRAEVMGTALELRRRGDASLADAVRAIRARARDPGTSSLALAHREFAAGCEAEQQVNIQGAVRRYAAAAANTQSPQLRAWARLREGGAVFQAGDPRRGGAIVEQIARTADSARHPALAAHADLLLAALAVRSDRFEDALDHAHRARALFAAAGEREIEGSAVEMMFIAHVRLGDPDRGYPLALEGLRRLRPYRGSFRLHNLLAYLARTLGDDGLRRAAVRVQDEGVRVAARTGIPVFIAEGHLSRARLLGVAGASDVAAARMAMARLSNPDPLILHFLVSRRQIAEARAVLRMEPTRAARMLDSAATFFLDSVRSPFVAFPPMVDAAHAWLAAGDASLASSRLEAALAILERRRDRIRMEPRRAAVFEEARELVDRMTLLRLAEGRPDRAVEYLDRGRASLATVGSGNDATPDGLQTTHPGEVALVYGLIGDTLLVWTIAGERVEVDRTLLDRARLVRNLEQLRRQLASAASEEELRPGLSRLYDLLVRPMEDRLGAAETPVVVVADGELGSVPFAALYDIRRERYLVEDHPLRFAASLREARRPLRRSADGLPPLFVVDPAFDKRAHRDFQRLPEAAEEVRQIVGRYRGERVLADVAAHESALRAKLPHARLVHYAGHAVFDDERPERSYLLLAPAPNGRGGGMLRADSIAQMDLRNVSLVVLSACQTVRTGPGRAAGFSGLAGAFLAAGAGGAVGSLWEVDDRHTRELMVEFHRAYQTSHSGSVALRTAQLRLLGSTNRVLRSPAAWAGFRYAGG
jgi:CHAT domain-containing protein